MHHIVLQTIVTVSLSQGEGTSSIRMEAGMQSIMDRAIVCISNKELF